MDIEADLKARVTAAIEKSLEPCPLMSPKWFTYLETPERQKLRFKGMPKLVKATGLKPKGLVERILANLDVAALGAEVKVADKYEIQIVIKKKEG